MRRSFLTVLTLCLLILASCSDTKSASPSSGEEPPAAKSSGAIGAGGANGPWVQDLWVYESVGTIADDGSRVDLTDDILAGLGTPSRSVELPEGATFHVHDSLAASVTTNGAVRSDVQVVAGVLEFEGNRSPAALATPAKDAERPIQQGDDVELDVAFLGDQIEPGAALFVDVAFLQARPVADESAADGLDLLAARLSARGGYYYGQQTDQGSEALAYQSVLGAVESGSSRMSVAGEPKISDALIDGVARGLSCAGLPIRCVKKYFEKVGKGAKTSNELLRCNLGSCDDVAQTEDNACVGLACKPTTEVRGDPHLTSFDGQRLSMQGVGEYVVTRTGEVDIQMRTAPVNATTRTASAVSMVGIRSGQHDVVIDVDPERSTRVWVDGAELAHDPAAGFSATSTHGDLSIVREGASVEVTASDGTVLLARHTFGTWLDLGVTPAPDGADLSGLLGDADGDPANDWTSREGKSLAPATAGRALYTGFSDTWRVTQDESILRYASGETTQDHTDLTFPEKVITIADLDPADRRRAEAVCKTAGVTGEPLLDECILDYAMSGEIGFVGSAQAAGQDVLSGGAPTPSPSGSSTGWTTTSASSGVQGTVFQHTCEPGGSLHTVWGGNGGTYTDDSSICSAAVHAGLLTVAAGGTVEVTRTAGLGDYGKGTTRNGVTTRDWEKSWSGSFTLAP